MSWLLLHPGSTHALPGFKRTRMAQRILFQCVLSPCWWKAWKAKAIKCTSLLEDLKSMLGCPQSKPEQNNYKHLKNLKNLKECNWRAVGSTIYFGELSLQGLLGGSLMITEHLAFDGLGAVFQYALRAVQLTFWIAPKKGENTHGRFETSWYLDNLREILHADVTCHSPIIPNIMVLFSEHFRTIEIHVSFCVLCFVNNKVVLSTEKILDLLPKALGQHEHAQQGTRHWPWWGTGLWPYPVLIPSFFCTTSSCKSKSESQCWIYYKICFFSGRWQLVIHSAW